MINKTVEIALLFDFYGNLLTEKQQQIIRLYYYEDLSLGEIAESLEISRQGVFDHLQRSEKLLKDYEGKLGLSARYRKIREKLAMLDDFITENTDNKRLKGKLRNRIEQIRKYL
ncbi:MAG TPA: YlxM family DNA-binding protein [Halanaerobiales bacterium]|nr:YlxM family DNA-binding protein [Halanaerobiales bacterium]